MKSNQELEKLIDEVESPQKFVSNWIQKSGLTLSSDLKFEIRGAFENGDLRDSLEYDYNEHRARMELLYREIKKDSKVNGPLPKEFTTRKLIVAFDKIQAETVKSFLIAERAKLEYNPEAVFDWTKLASCFSDNPRDLDIVVLKHFFRNVKRKLFGLNAENHLFLVLTGPEGTGKSTFLKRILDSIPHFSTNTTFASISDKREWQLFTDNYFCVIDEMDGADRASVNTVKEFLTQDSFNQREMKTTEVKKYVNNASFIGTSNHRLVNIIQDTTGMRRYYEFLNNEQLDRDVVNNFDFIPMFQSIDEKSESELDGHWLQELRNVQKDYRATTKEEDFLEALGLDPRCPEYMKNRDFPKTSGTHWFGVKEMYECYKEWSLSVGIGKVPLMKFFKQNLEERGYMFPKNGTTVDGVNYKGLCLPFKSLDAQLSKFSDAGSTRVPSHTKVTPIVSQFSQDEPF